MVERDKRERGRDHVSFFLGKNKGEREREKVSFFFLSFFSLLWPLLC